MPTSRIEIDLGKISHNAKKLKKLYGVKGISITAVTKVVCGDPQIAKVLVNAGINVLADSRISNLQKMRSTVKNSELMLLRTPSLSQSELTVQYTDMSLNTELSVIKRLSVLALKHKIKHKIILMVELGDLREGLMPDDLEHMVREVSKLKGVVLKGIGSNFACFGGVKPDQNKIDQLTVLADKVEQVFGMHLEVISGGNSANYEWFVSAGEVGKVNNLRLGESIFLGCEALHRKPIPGLYTNAFSLITEVIESKIKPSRPYGQICQNVAGQIPVFHDNGKMRRIILNIGQQDVLVAGLIPEKEITILGSSSDHIIVKSNRLSLKVGDEVKFNLNYAALLAAMTSPYVNKRYIN